MAIHIDRSAQQRVFSAADAVLQQSLQGAAVPSQPPQCSQLTARALQSAHWSANKSTPSLSFTVQSHVHNAAYE